MLDVGCWVLAIALLGVYCGLSSSSELERRGAIAGFLLSGKDAIPTQISLVEPMDLQVPDSR
jgi:hypothetical protein